MNLERRLDSLAQRLGTCPVHQATLPDCPRCHPQPLPEVLEGAMRQFVDQVVSRVEQELGRAGMQALASRVPRLPTQEVCQECGTRRACWRCGEDFTRRLLAAFRMTREEARQFDACLALARQIDAQRARAQ
jgi:hypothetical protein